MKNQLFGFMRALAGFLQQTAAARWLLHRFPRVYHFIINRFKTDSFAGLPFTFMLVLLGIQLLVLSQLAEDVVESDEIVTIDKRFTHFLYEARNPDLSKFFYGITQLGTRLSIFTFGILASILLIFHKRILAVVCFWATMGGIGLSVVYGKRFFLRDRPEMVGYYLETNSSFPSGHATTVMALFGFLTYFVLRYTQSWIYRKMLVFFSLLLIILVCFSRIYLGVHFLSDVLAGMLVGSAWLVAGIAALEYFSAHHPKGMDAAIEDKS